MIPGTLDRVEARARQRFHRFSERAWSRWLDLGARPLAQALQGAVGWTDAERDAVLEAALALGAEAVGLGYLHVAADATHWFSHAFGPLLAERVVARPPRVALDDLAALWNLSEGLEHCAPWIRALFSHFRHGLLPHVGVGEFVGGMERSVGDAGLLELGDDASRWSTAWLPCAPLPANTLPGRVAFLAPRVVAVEHRGEKQASFFLLQPSPLPLGMGPLPSFPSTGSVARVRGKPGLLDYCRAGDIYSDAVSPHAWVGSPNLSQRVLFAWRAE